MNTQTDNLEARAKEWIGRDMNPDLDYPGAPLAPILAAFARSLAPSGAVVEAMREAILQARAAAHDDTVEGRYAEYRKWDTDLDEEHKEQFDVLASPSMEPTVDELLECVDDEPELPDDMPDAMWDAIRNDRPIATMALRSVVALTKEGIRERIKALLSK